MTSPSTAIEAAFAEKVPALLEIAPALLHKETGRTPAFSHVFCEAAVDCASVAVRTRRRSHPVHFRSSRRTGGGVQINADGAVHYRWTEELSPQALLQTAAEAHAAAGTTGGTQTGTIEAGTLPDFPPDSPARASDQEKSYLMEETLDAALALDPRVCGVRVEYADSSRIKLVVSEGGASFDVDFSHRMRVEVLYEGAAGGTVKGAAHAGAAAGLSYYLHHPPAEIARRAVQQAAEKARARPPGPHAGVPVVFGPGWGGVWLHEALGHFLEADVGGGERIGRAIGPEWMVLDDDKRAPGGRGAYRMDDEGTPADCTRLVEGGRVTALLTDRAAASAHGIPRTGNARRQHFRMPAICRMSNLVLRPACTTAEEILADVRSGILVTDPESGSFHPSENKILISASLAYRIENGRAAGPLSPVTVEMSVGDIGRRLATAGSDFSMETARGFCEKGGQIVPISVGQPTVLFSALPVFSGKP